MYVKDISSLTGNRETDYPLVDCRECAKWMMGVYPKYHTHLFPDSKLHNEQATLIEDTSHTNGIYKVYVGAYPNFGLCEPGDAVIIYRTGDKKAPARYRAVITSVCVIEEIKKATSFGSFAKFKKYCISHSVFGANELYERYKNQYERLYAVKMTYNIAFPKRVTRGKLFDSGIISSGAYIGLLKLDEEKFFHALELGGVSENLIVN